MDEENFSFYTIPIPRKAITAPAESREQRTHRILNGPDFIGTIVANCANGGSTPGLCADLDIRFSDVMRWINADPARKALYDQANLDATVWQASQILGELNKLIRVDIRQAYGERDELLPIHKIPAEVASCIASIESDDLFEWEGSGQDREKVHVGYTRKVKFIDKLKSIELLGKKLAMFIERHEHKHTIKLEDLVNAAVQPGDNNQVAPAPAQ